MSQSERSARGIDSSKVAAGAVRPYQMENGPFYD